MLVWFLVLIMLPAYTIYLKVFEAVISNLLCCYYLSLSTAYLCSSPDEYSDITYWLSFCYDTMLVWFFTHWHLLVVGYAIIMIPLFWGIKSLRELHALMLYPVASTFGSLSKPWTSGRIFLIILVILTVLVFPLRHTHSN